MPQAGPLRAVETEPGEQVVAGLSSFGLLRACTPSSTIATAPSWTATAAASAAGAKIRHAPAIQRLAGNFRSSVSRSTPRTCQRMVEQAAGRRSEIIL